MEDTKKWYASKSIWGSILLIAALIAQAFGYSLGEADQAQLVDIFSGVAGSVGGVMAVVGRIIASKAIIP